MQSPAVPLSLLRSGKALGPMPPATEPTVPHLPAVPANSSVRRVAFTVDELDAIAAELGQSVALAPFRVHGQQVYRVIVPVRFGAIGPATPVDDDPGETAPVTTLTLWPSLRRVDASNPWATAVATGIVAVDLVTGVEAIFRHPGGSLTVTRNGRIMVRTGPITTDTES